MIQLDERTEFRAICQELGLSFNDSVIYLIKYYVDNEAKLMEAKLKKEKANLKREATRKKNKEV